MKLWEAPKSTMAWVFFPLTNAFTNIRDSFLVVDLGFALRKLRSCKKTKCDFSWTYFSSNMALRTFLLGQYLAQCGLSQRKHASLGFLSLKSYFLLLFDVKGLSLHSLFRRGLEPFAPLPLLWLSFEHLGFEELLLLWYLNSFKIFAIVKVIEMSLTPRHLSSYATYDLRPSIKLKRRYSSLMFVICSMKEKNFLA